MAALARSAFKGAAPDCIARYPQPMPSFLPEQEPSLPVLSLFTITSTCRVTAILRCILQLGNQNYEVMRTLD